MFHLHFLSQQVNEASFEIVNKLDLIFNNHNYSVAKLNTQNTTIYLDDTGTWNISHKFVWFSFLKTC